MISKTITFLQIVIPIAVIILILLQERSAGLGGLFGGDGGFYQTRRGMEKITFWGTIIGILAFLAVSVWKLLL